MNNCKDLNLKRTSQLQSEASLNFYNSKSNAFNSYYSSFPRQFPSFPLKRENNVLHSAVSRPLQKNSFRSSYVKPAGLRSSSETIRNHPKTCLTSLTDFSSVKNHRTAATEATALNEPLVYRRCYSRALSTRDTTASSCDSSIASENSNSQVNRKSNLYRRKQPSKEQQQHSGISNANYHPSPLVRRTTAPVANYNKQSSVSLLKFDEAKWKCNSQIASHATYYVALPNTEKENLSIDNRPTTEFEDIKNGRDDRDNKNKSQCVAEEKSQLVHRTDSKEKINRYKPSYENQIDRSNLQLPFADEADRRWYSAENSKQQLNSLEVGQERHKRDTTVTLSYSSDENSKTDEEDDGLHFTPFLSKHTIKSLTKQKAKQVEKQQKEESEEKKDEMERGKDKSSLKMTVTLKNTIESRSQKAEGYDDASCRKNQATLRCNLTTMNKRGRPIETRRPMIEGGKLSRLMDVSNESRFNFDFGDNLFTSPMRKVVLRKSVSLDDKKEQCSQIYNNQSSFPLVPLKLTIASEFHFKTADRSSIRNLSSKRTQLFSSEQQHLLLQSHPKFSICNSKSQQNVIIKSLQPLKKPQNHQQQENRREPKYPSGSVTYDKCLTDFHKKLLNFKLKQDNFRQCNKNNHLCNLTNERHIHERSSKKHGVDKESLVQRPLIKTQPQYTLQPKKKGFDDNSSNNGHALAGKCK